MEIHRSKFIKIIVMYEKENDNIISKVKYYHDYEEENAQKYYNRIIKEGKYFKIIYEEINTNITILNGKK